METKTVEDKKIVVTGEVLSEDMGMVPGKNTFRSGSKIIAKRVGLSDVNGRAIKIIPLTGGYIPEFDDEVVGKIIETQSTGWQVNIGAPYDAYLPLSEYSMAFIDTRRTDTLDLMHEGDFVLVRVVKYTKTKNLIVSMKGRKFQQLKGGIVHKITAQKVPRLIGKKGSMIGMIKNATKTNIIVGPNGWVWIKGEKPEDELKAVEALKVVEENAHKQGLTEKVEKLLK